MVTRIGFRGRLVSICTNSPTALKALNLQFRDLEVEACQSLEPVGRLSIVQEDATFHVPIAGEESVRGGSLADALRCVAHHAARMLREASPELVWLHAGAAARGQRAVLVVGASGSGKSSLVVGLGEEGWAYLSDELVPLEPGTLCAVPFPLAPAVRTGPAHVLPPDEVTRLPKWTPELAASTVCREAVPINALVLPTYAPDVPADLVRCSVGVAAIELLRGCSSLHNTPGRTVASVSRLAERVPAFRLTFRDGRAAAHVLDRALRELW